MHESLDNEETTLALCAKHNVTLDEVAPALLNATSIEDAIRHTARIKQDCAACNDACAVLPGSPASVVFDGSETALLRARNVWNENIACKDPYILTVFTRFCRLAPLLSLIPTHVEEAKSDFVWSRITSIISGAGYYHWPKLCHILHQYGYPHTGDESDVEWSDIVLQAARDSKWPACLSCIAWNDVSPAPVKPEVATVEHSMLWAIVGLFHTLKHALVSPCGTYLNVLFHGRAQRCRIIDMGAPLYETTSGASMRLLGASSDTRGKGNLPPHINALRSIHNKLTGKNLIRQNEPISLPPSVLHGPWSSMVPDANAMHGFTQHGLRLTGTWVAMDGVIRDNDADDEDIFATSWDIADPFSNDKLSAKKEYEGVIPSTYKVQHPSEVFSQAFPNLTLSSSAQRILFDLPIYADLLRSYVPALRKEYPLVLFLPNNPTIEDSTDQGKSVATETYAAAMSPGIKISRIPDSTSSPDLRTIAEKFRTYGTIAVDEWRMASIDASPLSHDNLQSLITGGEVSCGRVMENSSVGVRLAHSIVASAKCVSFPPDMINRTFTFYLDRLSQEQRDNAEELARLRDGTTSLEMRLGAWADIETNGIAQMLRAAPKASGALRFEACLTLAYILADLRSVERRDIDKEVLRMHNALAKHMQEADDNGLRRAMYDGAAGKLSFSDLWPSDSGMLTSMRDFCSALSGGATKPLDFLRSLLNVYGHTDNTPFCKLLPVMTGNKDTVSNKAMCMRVAAAVRMRLAEMQYTMHPDPLMAMEGWGVRREIDKEKSVMFTLFNSQQDPTVLDGYERRN